MQQQYLLWDELNQNIYYFFNRAIIMLIGIHKGRYGKLNDNMLAYKQVLDYNQIPFIWLDINEVDFWNKVKELDLFTFEWSIPSDLQ